MSDRLWRTLVPGVVLALAVIALTFPFAPRAQAATSLLEETFTGASVADPRFVALGDACLTAAPRPSDPPAGASNLSDCTRTAGSPAVSDPGWLQLTDVGTSRRGAVLYDQALPSAYGLQVTFDQAQYGGSGADGIGFFLTQGAYGLGSAEDLGRSGGALGYAAKTSGTDAGPGVAAGVIGIGLDRYGNYANGGEGKGAGCAAAGENPGLNGNQPNRISLRGPAGRLLDAATGQRTVDDRTNGYCLLGSQPYTGLNATPDAPRTIRVTVNPPNAAGTSRVSVEAKNDAGTFVTILATDVPNMPSTFKFGFSASTGTSTDVHLVRNIQIDTVATLPSLVLAKEIDPESASFQADGTYAVGETVPYKFTVTNGGLTSGLSGVRIVDSRLTEAEQAAIICRLADGTSVLNNGTLSLNQAGSIGSSATCTGSHVLTEADLLSAAQNDQQFVNTATATANGGHSATDTETVNMPAPTTGLQIVKSSATPNDVNRNGEVDAGDTVQYNFALTNTGTVTLSDVAVTDPMLGLVGDDALAVGTLAPGASVTVAAPELYTITEADLYVGNVKNTATATGTVPPESGLDDPSANDDDTVQVEAADPGLEIFKEVENREDVNGNNITDAGDVVSYSFTVTNSGNVSLAPVTISDPQLGLSEVEVAASLAPGASVSVPAGVTYTLTEADAFAGEFVNTATATGTASDGSPVSDASSATVNPSADPAVLVEKSVASIEDVNGNGVNDTGDVVSYSFTVTNSGNVTLAPVTVSDEAIGFSGQVAESLAPGEVVTVTPSEATYTLTEADLLAGGFTNTATVSGQPAQGDPVTDEGSATVDTAVLEPDLTLVKRNVDTEDVNGNGITDAGDVVSYEFMLINSGNLTLSGLTIVDETLGIEALAVADLAPGASVSVPAGVTYTLTEADAFAGEFVNTATATGTASDGSPVSDASSATVNPSADPAVLVEKSVASIEDVNGNGVNDTGDVVSYSFTVTNSGNVTLAPVTVSDEAIGFSGQVAESLAPGEVVTVTPSEATYTLTEADLLAGGFTNTATVSGQPAQGDPVTDEGSATVTTDPVTGITVEKTGELDDANGNGLADVGERIAYGFTVTNTGNVPLSDVVVEDAKLGLSGDAALSIAEIEAFGTATVEAPQAYVVTEADMIAGVVANSATVTGDPPAVLGLDSPSDTDSHVVATVGVVLGITLEKSAELADDNGDGAANVGEEITYYFTVTNTGNVTLPGATIADAKLGISALAVGELAPGASVTVEAPQAYVVTAAEVAAGTVVNAATVTGDVPDGVAGDPPTADDTVTVRSGHPDGGSGGGSAGGDHDDGDDGSGPLPATGLSVWFQWLLVVGLTALCSGAVLIMGSARRREDLAV